jgi:hypothetical protein
MRIDPTTGRLLGRPTRAGNYSVILRASGGDGSLIVYRLSLAVAAIPDAAANNYTAVIARHDALNAGLGGDVSVRVNTNGTFTGRLRLGAASHGISGLVDSNADGDLFLTGTLPGGAGISYEIFIPVGTSTPEVDGFILGPGNVLPRANATVTGEISPWSAANPLPAGLRGNYTFAGSAPFDELAPLALPRGPIVGTLEAKADGSVIWTVYPSDGAQPVKGTGRLSVDGTLYVYAPSLSPTRGSILGTLQFTPSAATFTGNLTWRRLSTDRLAGMPATQAYLAGFGPVALDLVGNAYSRTTPVSGLTSAGSVLELRYASPALGDGSVVDVTGTVGVAANASTLTATALPAPLAFRGAIARPSGLVTGRFTAGSPARTINYTAVVLGDEGLLFGHFIVPPAPGTSAAPLGGMIALSPNLPD